jgi:CTP synthase
MVKYKGGTMRLGAYLCKIKKDTLAYKVYKSTQVYERHRHRYEFNNKYRKILQAHGLVISGEHPISQSVGLVEIIELKDHPFFIAVQFHPEFKSRFENPHPLFYHLVATAKTISVQK